MDACPRGRQLLFADEVMDRLPALFAALDTGRLDVPKARIIAELLASVEDRLAVVLVEKVIDSAEQWTTGQLRARLRRLVLAADPAAVASKARQGIRHRRVATYHVEHWNTDAEPFTWTATAEEILAKVRCAEANVKKLVANNSK